MSTLKHVVRNSENTVTIKGIGVDATLFANEDVPFDKRSIEEAVAFSSIAQDVERLRMEGYLSEDADVEKFVLTPDFHKGSGIPIGTVLQTKNVIIPKAVGNDVGCGMRLLTTDISLEEFNGVGEELDNVLRYIFFEGGRKIHMTSEQRLTMFKEGAKGLLDLPDFEPCPG